MKELTVLTVRKCPCNASWCRTYHPSPIGAFSHGSGFTYAEAHAICYALAKSFPNSFKYSEQPV